MKKQFKVKFKTMLDYWKGRNYKYITVHATSEIDAENIADSIIDMDSSCLAKQLYDMSIQEITN